MPVSDFIPTTGRTQATQTLYNNLVADVRRMLAVLGSNKTIASGAITVTPIAGDGAYKVDTESSAAEDDLDTINGGASGDIIVLNSVNAARFVRIRSGVGNILIPNSLYIDLHPSLGIKLRYDGTNWVMDMPFLGAGYIVLTNKSGGTVNAGDVVIWDKANASAFTTTTSSADRRVCGVVKSGQIANNAAGIIAVGGTIETVKVQGNVSSGQALITSTTTKRASSNGTTKQNGFIGYALTTYSGGGAGTVEAFLLPDHYMFGASVSFDTVTTIQASSSSPSGSVDCGTGSNRILLAVIFQERAGASTDTVMAPTIAGNSLTEVGSSIEVGAGPYYKLRIWRYIAPPTGSNTFAVNATSDGTTMDSYVAVCFAISNVNQTTPLRTDVKASGTSTNPSATATVSVGDTVFGGYFSSASANTGEQSSLGSEQSSVSLQMTTGFSTDGIVSGYQKPADSTSETMNATLSASRLWLAFAIGIQPA